MHMYKRGCEFKISAIEATMEDSTNTRTKNRCIRIVYVIWKIFTCLFTHVMLVSMVVSYCILGAVTFESLERDYELFVKSNISLMRNNVTEDLWKLTNDMPVLREENWTISAISRIKMFENDLILAIKKAGWDGSEDTGVLQWTFSGALFYSIIVITTIGYGHIAPKTFLGKVTTIFYAVFGIPLMLLCLSNIGSILAQSFRFFYWKVCCYMCTHKTTKPSRRRQHRSRSRQSGTRRRRAVSEERTRYTDSEKPSSLSRGRNTYPMRHVSLKGEPRKHQNSYIEVSEKDVKSEIIFNQYAIETEDTSFGYEGVSTSGASGDTNRRFNETTRSKQRYDYVKSVSEYGEDYSNDDDGESVKPVPIWLCVFLVVSYIIAGAFLFMDWEDWGLMDSAYFCFITLTTIGFGDYVPAQRVNRKNAEMSIALCSLYLLFGIALLAMSFNLVQEEVISNVKAVGRHLGIVKDDQNSG